MHQLGDGPTIARLSLGARLRALRTAAGITGGEAAAVIRSSGSKISRIESGLLPVRQRDVAQLLTLYGADGQKREPCSSRMPAPRADRAVSRAAGRI